VVPLGWTKRRFNRAGTLFDFEQWLGVFNNQESCLDVEFPAAGILYTKEITDFTGGNHNYTAVTENGLTIISWPGWSSDVYQDENFSLADTTSWEDSASAALLINSLFDTVDTETFYDGVSTFESLPIILNPVGKVFTNNFDWVDTTPEGVTLAVQVAIFNGSIWSSWEQVNKETTIAQLINGVDLGDYQIKYRVLMQVNTENMAPVVSKVELSLNSYKQIKFGLNGKVYVASSLKDFVLEHTVELPD